jgi:demethylmenaquinone methyltransferase/2-methoxy-6-polyprenyl-1,4-benzoquinol methylase
MPEMNLSQISYNRVIRAEKEVGNYYSRLSSVYDFLAASEKKYINQGLALLDPSAGESVLEIGFGTGHAQLIIGRSVQGGLSAGLDLSEGMSRIAQNKIGKAGFTDRISLIRSNSLPIPFRGEIFDGIFSSFTLELFDSPLIPLVLKECCRVLKPGGRLVIVSLSKDQPLAWMGRLYESLHARYPWLLDCRPIPVHTLISDAGYDIKQVQESSMWGLPVSILLAAYKEERVRY